VAWEGWEDERRVGRGARALRDCERGGKATARQGGKRGESEATNRKTQILTVKRHYTSRRKVGRKERGTTAEVGTKGGSILGRDDLEQAALHPASV
jgi:hypothetical protein